MKILFIGNNAVLPDYLHDSVFHGLRNTWKLYIKYYKE
jgi:hypothetical protein